MKQISYFHAACDINGLLQTQWVVRFSLVLRASNGCGDYLARVGATSISGLLQWTPENTLCLLLKGDASLDQLLLPF